MKTHSTYFIDLVITPSPLLNVHTGFFSTRKRKSKEIGEGKNITEGVKEEEIRISVKIRSVREVQMQFIGRESGTNLKTEKSNSFIDWLKQKNT